MKITQLRDKDKTTALTTMDMETWIGKTRTETKTQPVSAFREVLRYSLPDSRCYEADKLPKILPAAEFRRTEGGKQMKIYNGIVELTIGPLSGGPEITLVKQLAWEDSLRLYRFERTVSENMGEIYPPRQFASTEKRRSGDISCACLSFGREMLSAANSVQHFTQRA